MINKLKGQTLGKEGLIDMFECFVCGWRYDRKVKICENPKCGKEDKLTWK